jgi:chromosome segregation ATPase
MKAEIRKALNTVTTAMAMTLRFDTARTLQTEIERLEAENEELKEQLANDIANYTLQVKNLKAELANWITSMQVMNVKFERSQLAYAEQKVRADKLEKQLVKKDAVLLSIAHYLPCECDGGLLEDDCLKQRISAAEKAVKESGAHNGND